MRLAAHQPDLLPYPGFWVKMARSHLFDLAIYDQFQVKGYQRRVRMRGQWASLPVLNGPYARPIKDVRIHPESSVDALIRMVQGRYRNAPMWRDRGEMVVGWLDESRAEWLWQFNVSLILKVRDWLEITTPVSIATKPVGHGVDGLVDVCRKYVGATKYLSGDGGAAYMGENPGVKFAEAYVDLEWMNYVSPTGDSILSLLFDETDVRGALGL